MPHNYSKFQYNGDGEDFFSPDSPEGKRRLISLINAILQKPDKVYEISRCKDESRTLYEEEQCTMDFALVDNEQRLIDIHMYAPGSVFNYEDLKKSIVIHIVFDPVDNEGDHPHIQLSKTITMHHSGHETVVEYQTHIIQLKFWKNCSENSMLYHWMKFLETGELNDEDLKNITPSDEESIFKEIRNEKEALYREFENFLNKPSYLHKTIANKYLSDPSEVQVFLKMMNNMSKSIEVGNRAEMGPMMTRLRNKHNATPSGPVANDGSKSDVRANAKTVHDVNSEEQDKARSEATFRYVVKNVSKMSEGQLSPPCYIRNLPWRIKVMSKQPGEVSRTSLGVFLQCDGKSESTLWSCYATAKLRLLSRNAGQDPFSRAIQHLFCRKENDWGFRQFMEWDNVLNPEKGYIKDDEITLEVHMQAHVPQGIS